MISNNIEVDESAISGKLTNIDNENKINNIHIDPLLSNNIKHDDDEGTDHDLQVVERPFIYETKNNNIIDTSKIKNILVLGSGGLIGRNLVNMLKTKGYNVYEVKNRRHIDLRVPKILDQFEYNILYF